jgi:hypothetical protein
MADLHLRGAEKPHFSFVVHVCPVILVKSENRRERTGCNRSLIGSKYP